MIQGHIFVIFDLAWVLLKMIDTISNDSPKTNK